MEMILDASPLIYLAKLDAFDVAAGSRTDLVIPEAVHREAARPELAFRHPEVGQIDAALRKGIVRLGELTGAERADADELGTRLGGLHRGELEVLALGRGRGWRVCFHERQASRLASALGLEAVHVVELLFQGTRDKNLLRGRLRRFAALTNLATGDLDRLLAMTEQRERR